MMSNVAKRVAWMARTTTTVVGLAIMLALVLGIATTALAGTGVGARLDLGKTNVVDAVTGLAGSVAGPSFQIDNNNTGAGATALDLQVEPGKAPMSVNSDAKVTNLNADKIDGQDAGALKPLVVSVNISGALDTFAGNSGVESSRKVRTGLYEVDFDREVSGCVRVAGLGSSLSSSSSTGGSVIGLGNEGEVNTFNVFGARDKIGVFTANSAGTRADKAFQLAVFC